MGSARSRIRSGESDETKAMNLFDLREPAAFQCRESSGLEFDGDHSNQRGAARDLRFVEMFRKRSGQNRFYALQKKVA